MAKAKALYTPARQPWERIEPVAESFGDLDPKIDGREDVVEEGLPFTGYHRLEKDLWVDGLKADSPAIADQLLADVKTIVEKAKAVDFTALSIANGAKELLDEVATGRRSPARRSATRIPTSADMKANLQGSQSALEVAPPRDHGARSRPSRRPSTRRSPTINQALDQHRVGADYAALTALSADDVKALTVTSTRSPSRSPRSPGVVEAGAGGRRRRDRRPIPQPQPASGVSRRGLLGVSAGAAAAGVAVGFGGGYAAHAAAAPAAEAAPATARRASTRRSRSAARTRPASSPPPRTGCTSSPSTW